MEGKYVELVAVMLITLRRIVVFVLVGVVVCTFEIVFQTVVFVLVEVVVCMLEVVLQIDFAASSVEVERK